MIRNIKLLLVGFLGLALLLLVMGLIIPSNVKISRGILLSQSHETVYASLQDVDGWEAWMPWTKYDSTATVTRSERRKGAGASFQWAGADEKNQGTIRIVKANAEEISLLYEFKDIAPAKGGFRIRTIESGNGVELIWFMEYQLHWYPWERFYGIFADKIWGPVFEKGLADFQEHLNQQESRAMLTREN